MVLTPKTHTRPTKTLKIALVSSLTAASVSSRILLAAFPNIKLTAFLTAITAAIFGPIIGFLVGFLGMAVTDAAFFGMGYWTMATAPCMGLIGLLSGLLWFRKTNVSRIELALGGFFLTFLYDVLTSVLTILPFVQSLELAFVSALIGLYLPVPYPLGPVHEVSTALLMGMLGLPILKAIKRVGGD